MNRAIISVSLIGSVFIFIDVTHFFDSFVMFILFGMVPGQSSLVNANIMLGLFLGIAVSLFVGTIWTYRTAVQKVIRLLLDQLRLLSFVNR